ncbi:MAG: Uma2 family endonuclease [Planctomyces sp.]|nr:Uma2 family endonuclease [Planctomyces sp.]
MSTATNNTATEFSIPRSRKGEPTWELVHQFPVQGDWSEESYLAINSSRLIELVDGVLEFPPMPTWSHQYVLEFLYEHLKSFVRPRQLGFVVFAPLRVRVGPGRYREPDLVFATPSRVNDLAKPSDGADLVMEVVSGSPSDRNRDYIDKRNDYALAGIAEYWIVDPERELITVLRLPTGGGEYVVAGEFSPGNVAVSTYLPGFVIDVAACFAAGQGDWNLLKGGAS